jgi:hypothetical protein
MHRFKKALLFSVAMCAFGLTTAGAADLKQIGTLTVPGETLTNFDISFIDHTSQRYYFADRNNKSIDIFDVKTDKFVDRVSGFTGVTMKNGNPNNATSGPDGVLIADKKIWAGDGDSTVKIIDIASLKVTAVIPTGGATRLDEMAFDPTDKVFIGVNNCRRSAVCNFDFDEAGP